MIEFLVITRNIFESLQCDNYSDNWSIEDCRVCLESDEFALEYLSKYDYDVKRASFDLFLSLGCGKGLFFPLFCEKCVSIFCRLREYFLYFKFG